MYLLISFIILNSGCYTTVICRPENTYEQDDYYNLNDAIIEADVDQYSSYLLENADFFYQVMQEFPQDPTD